MNQILPLLKHDRETLNDIARALNAGKDVTTHTDAVSIPGWSGFGYIITDPGVGVYKISGGSNGSFLLGVFIGITLISLLVTFGGLLAAVIGAIGINGAFLSLFYIDLADENFDARCFASGLLIGLSGGFLALEGVIARALAGILGKVLTDLGLAAGFSPNLPTPLQCLEVS